MEISITRVKYGESQLPESWIFENGNTEKSVPIDFAVFLLKAGDRNILVDAGCETMPGFSMRNFEGSVWALQRYGIAPQEITDVVITHAHHDHIECVKYFTQATVYIQKEEYIAGRRYIPENMAVHTFTEECQIGENVRCVRIGGHTVGSCVVEVNQAEKCWVLCGDECYRYDNLFKKIPTGKSVCRERSRHFIQKYSDPKYICMLCHEAPSP